MSYGPHKSEVLISSTFQSAVFLKEGLFVFAEFIPVMDRDFSDLNTILDTLLEADITKSDTESARNQLSKIKSEDSMYEVIFQAFNVLRSNLKILDEVRIAAIDIQNDDWFSKAFSTIDQAYSYIATLKREKSIRKIKGLYVILDSEFTKERNLIDIANQTLSGGTRILQLRNKNSDKSEVLDQAIRLKEICESAEASFVVNDDPDIALLSKAHGLHLGQTDLGVNFARQMLENETFIGRSNNNLEEASESENMGADYLAIGTVFPTSTMGKSNRIATGLNTIRELRDQTELPIVAIGGINAENVKSVVDSGADSVCVVSAITMATDPELETQKIIKNMVI